MTYLTRSIMMKIKNNYFENDNDIDNDKIMIVIMIMIMIMIMIIIMIMIMIMIMIIMIMIMRPGITTRCDLFPPLTLFPLNLPNIFFPFLSFFPSLSLCLFPS